MTVTAQVKIDEGSAHALSASMVFDPSRCRGKDVDGTASIDEAWSDVPDALWDVALKGVSYGKYKGNIRQMKWLIENGKSIEGISSVILTPNTYSPHPSAEITTMALIDYIGAGHTLPGALGAMLTSDEMLLPPDAIKRAQTLGYSNTMSPSNLRNGYSFLRDSTLPSSVKASYMQQAAATATFASSANRLTEQAVLSQVALSDSDERVRLSAVERVTDQKILRQVALNDSKPKVRLNAVSRLAGLKADQRKKERASAHAERDARLAAGLCPVCGGEPFEQILMSGNTGCIDCASTGTARVYNKHHQNVYKYEPRDEYW